jgi:predicted O-methyltransferase YrrM
MSFKDGLKGLLDRFYFPHLVKRAVERFRRRADSCVGLADAVDLAFNFRYGPPLRGLCVHIRPGQIPSEITELLREVESLKPRVVCEIGTASGGTLFLFTRAADPAATLVSIDLPGAAFGKGYGKAKIVLFRAFIRQSQQMHLLPVDSHEMQTKLEVQRILGGRQIDFLFIDGDHRYDGVKQDFSMYAGLVRPGGLIAFHDIVPGDEKLVGGVPQFWQEIKPKYAAREVVVSWQQGGFGLGLLRV